MNRKQNRSPAEEKQRVAAGSVLAVVGLAVFKVVIGLTTGSLGILAEAAHSCLDLLMAVTTFVAVRISGKPADREHHYGHGKVENFSALVDVVVLLGVCYWIIFEAVGRIRSGDLEIKVGFWSFAVMIVSMAVSVWRSHALSRTAKKHNSHALEADALHFQTDIWSSCVVILGLFCVQLSEWADGYGFLHYADAAAAIIVGIMVAWVSVKLGVRSVKGLLDSAPPGLEEKIMKSVAALPGVLDCHHVRVRFSGTQHFIDLHVLMNAHISLAEAHALTEEIEHAIQTFLPGADITVHPEPQ